MTEPLPPLRADLEVVPVQHEGRPLYVVRDPEAIGEDPVALSAGGMAVASMLDGRLTVEDIRAAFLKEAGSAPAAADIEAVVRRLDASGLLETPASREKRQARLRAFLEVPSRPAVFQGAVYPGGALELANALGAYYRDAKGPGKPAAEAPGPARAVGLVSPHIDFARGGPAYAWAYQALSECAPPELVVALGVAHASPDSPWVMTRKDYETPYGPMRVDEEIYEDVRRRLWYDPRADERVHRREHSLEFQAVWLKSLWRDQAPPWLPILCSSFDRFCPDRAPSSVATVEEALDGIGRLLAERGKTRRLLVLAGVDLAHVGPRFGDELKLGRELEERVEREDRASLEKALALDADGFYLSVVADGHWRKVCGLSALYTSVRWIRALGGAPGRLLTYGQAPDPVGGLVSFAGAIYGAA